MSAYLARLKQLENEKNSHYVPNTELTKPTKPPFVSFGGTGTGHIVKKIIDDVEIIAPPEPSEIDRRSMRALAMLDRCTAKRAIFNTVMGDAVILTVAIRGLCTCELSIPKAKFDPWRLLELIERHGQATH